MTISKEIQFATQAVHAGQAHDGATGAVIPPISLSTTFAQTIPGQHKGFEYSRSGNPNRNAFEEAVATLEGGKYGIAFSSGSVTTATVVSLLKAGDHIVSINDTYGGTSRYFRKVATKNNIEIDFVDFSNPSNVGNAIKPNTKLVWVETPTNPTLRLADIRAVSDVVKAKSSDIIIVVDNTFMSPYFQNPLSLGADIVVHSVTKYIAGHSDVVMGIAILNDDKLYSELRFLQNAIGGVPSAFDCFLAHRGLKTLHLRMKQHSQNALKIAEFLEAHPFVSKVLYPGLKSHPQHDIAIRQTTGSSGMVSFYLKNENSTEEFLRNLKIFTLAESLGGVESLIEVPSLMTHGSIPEETRILLGITNGLIRLSVGIEDAIDLSNDLDQAIRLSAKE